MLAFLVLPHDSDILLLTMKKVWIICLYLRLTGNPTQRSVHGVNLEDGVVFTYIYIKEASPFKVHVSSLWSVLDIKLVKLSHVLKESADAAFEHNKIRKTGIYLYSRSAERTNCTLPVGSLDQCRSGRKKQQNTSQHDLWTCQQVDLSALSFVI